MISDKMAGLANEIIEITQRWRQIATEFDDMLIPLRDDYNVDISELSDIAQRIIRERRQDELRGCLAKYL